MVYDNSDKTQIIEFRGKKGYAIHEGDKDGGMQEYKLYTDDGRGNGDFVCRSHDLCWIRRIAIALDEAVE